MLELIPLLLFLVTFGMLLTGYPVAITLAGVALIFAGVGIVTGTFNANDLGLFQDGLFGCDYQPNADRRAFVRVYGGAVRKDQNRRKSAD